MATPSIPQDIDWMLSADTLIIAAVILQVRIKRQMLSKRI